MYQHVMKSSNIETAVIINPIPGLVVGYIFEGQRIFGGVKEHIFGGWEAAAYITAYRKK